MERLELERERSELEVERVEAGGQILLSRRAVLQISAAVTATLADAEVEEEGVRGEEGW